MRKKLLYFSLFLFILIFSYQIIEPNINKLCESNSTNTNNTITVKYSSAFLLGPNKITIRSKNSKLFGSSKYTTTLRNDGKNLSEDNVSITWLSNDIALITLIGEEEPSKLIRVNFNSDISYDLLDTTIE